MSKQNPWKRSDHPDCEYRLSPEEEYYFDHLAEKRPKFTYTHCDFKTKQAGFLASPFVVSLVSYTGDEQLYQSCGTIIEVDEQNIVTVITSANLIRRPTENEMGENCLADNLKVTVHASGSYEGEICVYDYHYNLVIVKFKSDTLEVAPRLRTIDDCSNLRLYEENQFQLHPHSVKLQVQANDTVIAVGRYFTKPFDLMVASGCFSRNRCGYDCKELFATTCHITRCGDGGPLVNLAGEIIGINFYNVGSLTPFMPMNVVKKWWDHYKTHRELRHSYLGFDATTLYVADVDVIERVLRSVPSIFDGIIVERVIPESAAHLAGLLKDDVIVRCNGKKVESFLQLFEEVWRKVGGTVELLVVRAECSTLLSFSVMVVEATPDKMNRWPLWEPW